LPDFAMANGIVMNMIAQQVLTLQVGLGRDHGSRVAQTRGFRESRRWMLIP
jgi:hypothetical protein